MTGRMTVDEFQEHCGSPIMLLGFRLREGQTHPNNYAELVDFIGDRLKIEEPLFSVGALSRWLFDRCGSDDPASVECTSMNVEHVSSVLLIADLPDPDEYVASFPDTEDAVYLPPVRIVRQLLSQNL